MKNTISSPKDLSELMCRTNAMAGLTLGQLASAHQLSIPDDLKRNKGWIGQLIELELGAMAGSKPEQDFVHLGVELKTIPINSSGVPLETTYVCVAPLLNIGDTWENSLVCHKLQRVLWVPIQGDKHLALTQRKIGTGVLWTPSAGELAQIRQDWEEIMEFIALGQVSTLSARHGEVLQLRPKAANSRALTRSISENGDIILTNPRGFYLKTHFTQQILHRFFAELPPEHYDDQI